MSAFQVETDYDVAERILDSEIIHDYERESEMKDALNNLLERYAEILYDSRENSSENSAMEKHIRKLEKMLVRRGVRFKDWDETQYGW